MAAPRNFVTGFNHNIKHRGQVFHVQTEDSGAEIAAITTHLFVGGTILSSRRHTYAELRQLPDLRDRVRALMEEQHKAMLRSLVRGEFDHLIEGVRAYQPGEIDAGPTAPAAAPVAPVQPEAPMLDLDGAVDVEITLDELEIEEWNSEPPPQRQVTPPRGTPLTPQPWGRGARSPGPAHSLPTLPGTQVQRMRPDPSPSFLPPDQALETFFGEDLISEKTLDQVILAYLAGEGDDGKKSGG